MLDPSSPHADLSDRARDAILPPVSSVQGAIRTVFQSSSVARDVHTVPTMLQGWDQSRQSPRGPTLAS